MQTGWSTRPSSRPLLSHSAHRCRWVYLFGSCQRRNYARCRCLATQTTRFHTWGGPVVFDGLACTPHSDARRACDVVASSHWVIEVLAGAIHTRHAILQCAAMERRSLARSKSPSHSIYSKRIWCRCITTRQCGVKIIGGWD